jgi:hypothetical protein
MTAPDPDPEWVAALIEQKVAELDDDAFAALVARTRAPSVPKGNHIIPGVGNQPQGNGAEAIQAAEQSGDWARSFALKAQRLNALMHRKP